MNASRLLPIVPRQELTPLATNLGHMGPSSGSGEGFADGVRPSCFDELNRHSLEEHLDDDRFFWLDLTSPTESQIEELGALFDLHPLALEDTINFGQRPKLDDYGEYAFLVFFGAATSSEQRGDRVQLQEVHMFVAGGYVITVHDGEIPELVSLRKRIEGREVRSELFLVYQVLDAVTDTFFPVLARVDEEIDAIEDDVIREPGEEQLQRIFSLKRDLVAMRRVVSPQRDMLARGMDQISGLPGLQTDVRDYLRDVYDHLIRISDLVDSYRDLLSGATDMHLSTVANRQGEVAKQLTIIATIFLPLTFITGFFGQNFAFLVNNVMNTTVSFVLLGLGTLVISSGVFLMFFRRRGWL